MLTAAGKGDDEEVIDEVVAAGERTTDKVTSGGVPGGVVTSEAVPGVVVTDGGVTGVAVTGGEVTGVVLGEEETGVTGEVIGVSVTGGTVTGREVPGRVVPGRVVPGRVLTGRAGREVISGVGTEEEVTGLDFSERDSSFQGGQGGSGRTVTIPY